MFHLKFDGIQDFDCALNGTPQFTVDIQELRYGTRHRAQGYRLWWISPPAGEISRVNHHVAISQSDENAMIQISVKRDSVISH